MDGRARPQPATLLPRRIAGAVLMAALATAQPPAAAAQHTPLGDAQIKMMVEHELSEKDIKGVTVTVKDRVVTLGGTVSSLWAKTEAIDQARDLDDVRSVVSDLTIARAESDQAIANELGRRVRRYVFYTIFDDVGGTVNDGVVTLNGRVTMPFKSEEIGRMASRIAGVQEVKNDIGTLPASLSDDQLRHAIAAQIYRDSIFFDYSIQVNPPIHVIVENSRVTLTGVVRSELERRKAEIIARSTFGVLGAVDNRLQIEK